MRNIWRSGEGYAHGREEYEGETEGTRKKQGVRWAGGGKKYYYSSLDNW
jgi:hypothetical protein